MSVQLPRALEIFYSKPPFKNRLYITKHKSNTQIFTVENNPGSLFSPAQLTVFTVDPTPTKIGTATFHTFSSNIELTMHRSSQTMKRHRLFSRSYDLRSATGAPLQWKPGKLRNGLTLVDVESGKEIGKFNPSFGIRELGRLEFNVNENRTLFEEVLVSALAVVEARRRATAAAVNANMNAGMPAGMPMGSGTGYRSL